MANDAAQAARSRLDKFLSIFADVQAGEGRRVLALTANIFTLMIAYYLLKVVREPLVLTDKAFGLKGAELKNAAAAGQAVLLLLVVPLYARLAARVGRIRLINTVTAIFVICLAGFYVLAGTDLPIGFVFFIWLGIVNVMLVALFWSFANDLYTPDAGKRVFAIVAFGQTFGPILGSALAGWLLPPLGVGGLMLLAGALFIVAAVFSNGIDRAATAMGSVSKVQAAVAPPGATQRGGFRLVWKSRYLMLIGLMVLVYNTVNTNGEYILGDIIVEKAHDDARAEGLPEAAMKEAVQKTEGVFFAGYFAAQSILSALLQLFVVSRILQFAGVRWALLVMPTISFGGYAIIALAPLLWLVKGAKILENSIDYSLENTTKQTLYLPTTRAEKYQAKAAIDTFFVRFGDVVSFGVVSLSTVVLGLGVKTVAIINVALVVVWWLLALGVGRHHDRLVAR